MKFSLVVLAAGMGSRFGGLKQVEPMGPNGEFILDYSIYDACQAGFSQIIFVIREEMQAMFEAKVCPHFQGKIPFQFVYQDGYDFPEEYQKVMQDRNKPWGTGHAILACKNVVRNPFCVINADDFYGAQAYAMIHHFLEQHVEDKKSCSMLELALVGYKLRNTLSDHGVVARGICQVDQQGYLQKLVEQTEIKKEDADILCFSEKKHNWCSLSGDEIVSLNLWGFSPQVFPLLDTLFGEFLEKNAANHQTEFFITTALDRLIKENKVRITVLPTDEQWFGMTYQEDKLAIKKYIQEKIQNSSYPEKLC